MSTRLIARMSTPVVTRFAPSPTGFLHIGGARTALFNWLYARHTGGKMLLRIEDTDRERSTDAAIAAILDGLTWLGLDWDGEPIHQFARAARHREVAEELVASRQGLPRLRHGRGAERDARQGARRGPLRRAMTAAGATATRRGARRASPSVIRIKSPLDGETVIEDRVQGRVAFPNKDLDDFVILRSDGTPTYMLAVVVDDHDMGVTHIIRGDDHLTNGGRQKILYDAIGWDRAGDGAHPADPRPGRRQALQAPRRASASMPTAPWATCPRRCATTSSASAGRTATTRSCRPSR